MNTKLIKIAVPAGLGLILSAISIWGMVGCEVTCADGQLKGSNGHCYECQSGSHATYSYEGAGCSSPINGVYCCNGGGSTGCTPTGCPSDHPWKCGATCYVTPPSGDHSCVKCP